MRAASLVLALLLAACAATGDRAPLRALGVPELIVTQDDALYFDVHHTPADTVATLDRAGMDQAAGVFAAIAHAVSERPEPLGRLAPGPAP